jgi:hypothetical protein
MFDLRLFGSSFDRSAIRRNFVPIAGGSFRFPFTICPFTVSTAERRRSFVPLSVPFRLDTVYRREQAIVGTTQKIRLENRLCVWADVERSGMPVMSGLVLSQGRDPNIIGSINH